MKQVLKLKTPVTINGIEYKELNYDIEEIDFQLFTEAEMLKSKALGNQAIQMSTVVEFDRIGHLYLGMASIIACNKKITFSDLEQLKGKDIASLIGIGRGFYLGQAG